MILYPLPLQLCSEPTVTSLVWPCLSPTFTLSRPLQVEGSFLPGLQEESDASRALPFPNLPSPATPAPRVRLRGHRLLGEVGPHCTWPCLLSTLSFPLCRATWGVLCHRLHKDFSQTNIQGFPSCRVGRWHSCLPCQGSCFGQNIWGFGDSCGNCSLPGASQVLKLT